MARNNWYKLGTDGDPNGADYDGALKRIDQEQQDGDPTSDYLRYTTAKDLVDANVASFVANETAKKNVQNQLGSMGLGNNGYAATVGAMMGNQLNSSLASNQRAYDEAIRGIELDEAQKADQLTAERANAIVNNMSLLSGSALQEYMKEQGFTWNEDTQTWSNPDYPDAIVNDINTNYKISNGLYGAKPITSINDINVEGYNSTNIQNEYDYLMSYYRQNPPTEGYVVEMKNGEGKGVAYVQYRGGNWYQVSKDVYDRVGDGNRRTLYKMPSATDQAKDAVWNEAWKAAFKKRNNNSEETYVAVTDSKTKARLNAAQKYDPTKSVYIDNGKRYRFINGDWYEVK